MKLEAKNCSRGSLVLSIIFSVLLSVYGGSAAQDYDHEQGECGKEELIRCVNPLQMITPDNKELSFVSKKEDLDRMCPDLKMGLICVETYTRRCMSQDQQDHFNRLYRGTTMVIRDMCQEGEYQQEFLRHAPCVQKVRSEYENCASKYQQELSFVHQNALTNASSQSDSNNINVKKVCCSFQTYLTCSEQTVLETCGPETANFTKGFLDKMASSLIQIHCEKYPAGSEECSPANSALRLRMANLQLVLMLVVALMLLLLQLIRT